MNLFTSDAAVKALIQENLLEHAFLDPMKTDLLWRGCYSKYEWPANATAASIMKTKYGQMALSLDATPYFTDPTTGSVSHEQWEVAKYMLSGTLDSDAIMDQSALASTLQRNFKALGRQAGRSVNVSARRPLYNAALAGQTKVTSGANNAVQTVDYINGFTHVLVGTTPVAVSSTNHKTVYVRHGDSWATAAILAVTPTTPGDLFGPGTLTFTAPIDLATADAVVAIDASYKVISGGGYTVEDIGTSDKLTLKDITDAVSRLRQQGVPTFDDGTYHVHLAPSAMAQLATQDTNMQLLFRGNGLDPASVSNPYVTGLVYRAYGCTFFENAYAVQRGTVQGDTKLACPINNASYDICTTLVVGGDDGSETICELFQNANTAQASEIGMSGKFGSWEEFGDGSSRYC